MNFLAALVLIRFQPFRTTVERQTPAPQAPLPPASDADILAWRGWNYLGGAKGSLPAIYPVGIDFSQMKPATGAKEALVWHERIVIFTQTEREIADSDGVWHADRHSFESLARKRVEASVARLGDWISAETGGRLRFQPELSVEPESMRRASFGEDFAEAYLGPRINGGGYEAEDKLFRGPYQGAMLVLPGVQPGPTAQTVVNGTPVSTIYEYLPGTPYVPGDLEGRLHSAWLAEIRARLAERRVELGAGPFADVWGEAVATTDLPTDALLARTPGPVVGPAFQGAGVDPTLGIVLTPTLGNRTANTEVAFAADPDHGQVLDVTERGVDRNGGFAFPVRADGSPLARIAQTPSLSFDIRSTSAEPIGMLVRGAAGQARFSLGRQWAPPADSSADIQIPFAHDGKWQHVVLDLGKAVSLIGPEVTGIEVAPTPEARLAGRLVPDPVEIDLDNVKFSGESPTASLAAPRPDASSPDPEERALFAVKADVSSPVLVTLLADKSELVRLNAALAYRRLKDPLAQPALLADMNDLDPAVAEAAIHAYVQNGGAEAIPAIRRTVHFGITPLARAVAAQVLADTKDPAYGTDIVSLIVDRSRLCRLASARALAGVPGHEAALRRMAFILQEDPELKLAVTVSADPTDEYEMRKLLWSAVNEPSDLVRAQSDIKLIQSPDPAFRLEGYKGVRDDSPTVRLIVLRYLREHPNELHRNALRQAVTDRSARVRAEALLAFAALEKGAQADEVANVMLDRDPSVDLALLALAKKSGFKLGEPTRQMFATSPDPRVKQAFGGQ